MKSLNKHKFALITGAAGLLGKYHCEALAEDNFNLIITDLSKTKLQKLKSKLLKKFKHLKIFSFVCDVTSTQEVKNLYRALKIQKIFVSCLINNAEKNPKMSEKKIKKSKNKIEDYDNERLLDEISVGIFGTFNCISIFGYQMSKKKTGVIINISSDLGIVAPDHRIYDKNESIEKVMNFKPISYTISKHAIGGISKYVSTYWAHKNVRCNTLVLGAVLNNQPKSLIDNVKKRIPLNRWAKKNEYKKAIQFLASSENSYMTGQTLIVDGGRTIW